MLGDETPSISLTLKYHVHDFKLLMVGEWSVLLPYSMEVRGLIPAVTDILSLFRLFVLGFSSSNLN